MPLHDHSYNYTWLIFLRIQFNRYNLNMHLLNTYHPFRNKFGLFRTFRTKSFPVLFPRLFKLYSTILYIKTYYYRKYSCRRLGVYFSYKWVQVSFLPSGTIFKNFLSALFPFSATKAEAFPKPFFTIGYRCLDKGFPIFSITFRLHHSWIRFLFF